VAEPAGARPGLTPSQTVGPFLHLALSWPDGPDVVPAGAPGAVLVGGRVLDGAGAPVADALVETWQADAAGSYDPGWGFGRCPTDAGGAWAVRTLKPGRVPAADGRLQAPHLAVSVFARGLLDRVVTRVYFADEAEANDADPVLALVAPPRRSTLLAVPVEGGYRFDVHLQGTDETVFLAI
jgi:protocatechuate 3,4-dioxygenase alpha subunit